MTALLDIQDLRCSFLTAKGEVRAVDGVSFSIDSGESLGVVGESGSGKTVTAMSVLRLFPVTANVRISGKVMFEGVDILRARPRELRRIRGGRIGVVFQDPLTSLDPVMPVGDQISEAILVHRDVTRRAARLRAIELMERVGIPDPEERSNDLPYRFSGGMRQRIMIAMAISCEPKLLIADEATTALDATVQAQILSLLDGLQREFDMATMVISHDFGVVAAVCDRVQVMYAGQVVERAPIEPLLLRSSHPYTTALLHLVPKLEHAKHHQLHPIPGAPPLTNLDMQGCRFAQRCQHRMPVCDDAPPLFDVSANHLSACWLASPATPRGATVAVPPIESAVPPIKSAGVRA